MASAFRLHIIRHSEPCSDAANVQIFFETTKTFLNFLFGLLNFKWTVKSKQMQSADSKSVEAAPLFLFFINKIVYVGQLIWHSSSVIGGKYVILYP